MKRTAIVFAALLPAALPAEAAPSERSDLWSHVRSVADLGELREVTAKWDAGAVRLVAVKSARYAWATVPAPPGGWKLDRRATVEAVIANRGTVPAAVMLWVVGSAGWDAVPDAATLAPGEVRKFACPLRATFPDGTPKLDPGQIQKVQVMARNVSPSVALEMRNLAATGEAPEWTRPPNRLNVPEIEAAPPAAGRRVHYRLAGDEQADIYSVLYLPADWRENLTYPVIAEYPGNVSFPPEYYSTGRPDQCVIGYGISKGQGAIWVSLPFVDRPAGTIAEHGWGDADATAEYATRMVEEVCAKFGGDRRNVLLTGFSRGAIACGYIGLRDERIARLWKGFHACQHYDGDGWNGATMAGALERARRFRGAAVFHTDNSESAFQPVMEAMKTRVTYVRSDLGAHACTMFLDDRPSTQQLRSWWADLVAEAYTDGSQPLR